MKHVSAKDLTGDAQKALLDARRQVYRQVLRDPGASKAQKDTARLKLGR